MARNPNIPRRVIGPAHAQEQHDDGGKIKSLALLARDGRYAPSPTHMIAGKPHRPEKMTWLEPNPNKLTKRGQDTRQLTGRHAVTEGVFQRLLLAYRPGVLVATASRRGVPHGSAT